jgi:5,5'-dehydrodivanillate O-demethylase
LSTGIVEGDTIRCHYHGWRYDGFGECVEAPGEGDAFVGKVKIRSYPSQVYKGLIFAHFGEGEAPPLPQFFEMEGVLEVVATTEVWPCNYSNRLDNDANHLPFVHRQSRRRANMDLEVAVPVSTEETEYGIKSSQIFPGGKSHATLKIWPNAAQHAAPLRLRTKSILDESVTGGGWMDRRLWRVPVDDEHCISFGVDLVHLKGDSAKRYQELHERERLEQARRTAVGPSVVELGEAVLSGKLKITDIKDIENSNLILIEDYIAQVGQGAVPDYTEEKMGHGDAETFLRRKIWERELRALAEVRALKRWTYPPQLSAVVGA